MKLTLECQCERWREMRCHDFATGEDLVCDVCRDGCVAAVTVDGSMSIHTDEFATPTERQMATLDRISRQLALRPGRDVSEPAMSAKRRLAEVEAQTNPWDPATAQHDFWELHHAVRRMAAVIEVDWAVKYERLMVAAAQIAAALRRSDET